MKQHAAGHFGAARVLINIITENLGESGFIECAKIVLCRAKYEKKNILWRKIVIVGLVNRFFLI